MTRHILRGECNRCGGCCRMSIIAPKVWKSVQDGMAAQLAASSQAAGEPVGVDETCARLRWTCDKCDRVLSTTPTGFYCRQCGPTTGMPKRTKCMEYDRRPSGCRIFPRTPAHLAILQYRLKKAGRPPCPLYFEEVKPRWQMRKDAKELRTTR